MFYNNKISNSLSKISAEEEFYIYNLDFGVCNNNKY